MYGYVHAQKLQSILVWSTCFSSKLGQFSDGSLIFAHDERPLSPHVSICLDSYNVGYRLQRTLIQFTSFLKTILTGKTDRYTLGTKFAFI